MRRTHQIRFFTAHPRTILRELEIKPRMKVLDIGCGVGFHSGVAALKGAEVIPLDIEKKNIEITNKTMYWLKRKKHWKRKNLKRISSVPLKLPGKKGIRIEQTIKPKRNTGVVASAEHLPFQSEVFDRVIMLEVLQHIGDKKSALEEIRRVLKPGGKVLIHTAEYEKVLPKVMEKFGFEKVGKYVYKKR